jgi:hypothetical protein
MSGGAADAGALMAAVTVSVAIKLTDFMGVSVADRGAALAGATMNTIAAAAASAGRAREVGYFRNSLRMGSSQIAASTLASDTPKILDRSEKDIGRKRNVLVDWQPLPGGMNGRRRGPREFFQGLDAMGANPA